MTLVTDDIYAFDKHLTILKPVEELLLINSDETLINNWPANVLYIVLRVVFVPCIQKYVQTTQIHDILFLAALSFSKSSIFG